MPDSAPASLSRPSLAEEHEALCSGVALVDRAPLGRLELLGRDRARFLQGLVTCDVKGLATGQGAFGFVPSSQGKILSSLVVLALPDRLWLLLPPGKGREISQHLGKYVLADDVQILPLADMVPITLAGPRAGEVLAEVGELPAEPFEHRRAVVTGIEVHLLREALLGVPAFTLLVSASVVKPLVAQLLQRPGVVPAGNEALELARIEAGIPAFGIDYGPDHFPQETGLEPLGVSYTKGCYLGQEVIARIHYRGKANRAARRLVFLNDLPLPGARLLTEAGEEVGTLGSVAESPTLGRLGIAVLHRKSYEPGTELAVEGGGRVRLEELPPLRLE
ncbi:MAG TPA: hypothetical protein VF017_05620 [Thermoanaerobaculia bacterium]|nr:hypothetical protein [Thermoanaerobaculia bacterium]